MNILDRRDLHPAQIRFATACAASRAHDALAREYLARYGDHGPDVSGCVRDHFPESVKTHLRALADEIREASQRAYAARPPRVHRATMHKLARAVAKRDGHGFYGPTA